MDFTDYVLINNKIHEVIKKRDNIYVKNTNQKIEESINCKFVSPVAKYHNLQNAYDAVLNECGVKLNFGCDGPIYSFLVNKRIVIYDSRTTETLCLGKSKLTSAVIETKEIRNLTSVLGKINKRKNKCNNL